MDIGESAIRAQIAWFRMLAASGFAHLDVPGGLAVASGLQSNTENGAVLDPGSPNMPQVVAWLAGHDVPASALLTAPAAPEWVEHLVMLGMTPENNGNEMGARVEELRWTESAPNGVLVTEVTTRLDLELAFGVLRAADWFDQDECTRRVNAAARMGYGPTAQVRHWIARTGPDIVGVAASFLFDSDPEPTVALIHCCVPQGYRRRGIGTALTRARIQAACRQGARHAVLSPSPEGYELHRTLGFTLASTPPNRWFYQENPK